MAYADDPFQGIDDDDPRIAKIATIHPGRSDKHGAYDPHRFYTVSKNAHDHSENIQVPFPPAVAALIKRVVELDALTEYRSKQDVIRDAVYHRLAFLADEYGQFDLTISLERHLVDVRAQMRREERATEERIVANAAADLEMMDGKGQWRKLQRELDELEIGLRVVDEDLRERLQGLIDQYRGRLKRFGNLDD